MRLTAPEVDVIFDKLDLDEHHSETRRRGYLVVDGLRVLALHCAHGPDPFPGRASDHFRRSMRLSPDELRHFVSCTISRDEYVTLLDRRTG